MSAWLRRWRQPRIFISYRRDDSAVHARTVYDELAGHFGAEHVFYDVEAIDYGERFAERIDARLQDCDVVVVLVGPAWRGPGDDGSERIASESDCVRREVAYALAARKRVIPVLIGGASTAAKQGLPADIAPLFDLNGLTFSDRQLGEGIGRLIDAVRGRRAVRDVGAAAWRRIVTWRGVAAGVIVVCAAWIALFDLVALDTRSASVTLWLADAMAPVSLSEHIRIVTVDPQTEAAMGTRFTANPAARRLHAQLIDRLAGAGARVVAFDLYLLTPSPPDDAVLLRSIAAARAQGTAVVFGAVSLQEGRPRMLPALRDAITQPAMLCVGQRLGAARSVPLVSQDAAAVGSGRPTQAVGLALSAAHPGAVTPSPASRRVIVVAARNQQVREIPYTETETVGVGQPCEPGAPGDTVYAALHRSVPEAALRSAAHRMRFDAVLALDDGAAHARFGAKTVLVGLTLPPADVYARFAAPPRAGLDLHADATSALLTGAVVRPLGPLAEFALMLLLAVVGARAALVAGRTRGRRALTSAALLGLWVSVAVAVCVFTGVLLNLSYHLGALVLGWCVARRRSATH